MRRRRRVRRVVAVLGALLVVVLILQLWLFVLPAGDAPVRADAVVVLAGPGNRIERAERLIQEGWADVLVLATDTPDNCRPDVPVRAQYCFSPDPDTTQGEARAVADLVREHGWHTLLVVVQNEQVRRVRMRLDRCLPDGVTVKVVAVRASLIASAARVVYESGALLKAATVQRSC